MLKILILVTILQLAPTGIKLDTNEARGSGSVVQRESNLEAVTQIQDFNKCIRRIAGIMSEKEDETLINIHEPQELKAGFEFIITNGKGIVIDTLKTCDEGKASSVHLQHGIYYVIQSKAPEGYELDENTYKVTIDKSLESSSIKSSSQP